MGKYSIYPDDAALERIAGGRKVTYVQQNSHFYIAALEPVGGLRVGFAWRVPCPDGNKKPYWELCIWADAAKQVVAAGTPTVGFRGCSDPIKWSKSSEAKFTQIRDALLDFAVWQSEDAIKTAWSKMYDFVQTQLAKHFAPTRMWRVIYETSGSYDLPVYTSTWRKSELAARKFAAKKGTYVIGEYSPAPPPWERDTQDCEPTVIATDFLSSDASCKCAYGRHENGRFCLTPKGVEWGERLSTDEAVMMPLYFDLWADTPELPFFAPGYPTELVTPDANTVAGVTMAIEQASL